MNEEINEITNNTASNPILDIVNTIQNKLNENNSTAPNIMQNNTSINSTYSANDGNTSTKLDLNNLDISKLLSGLNNFGNKNTNINNSTNNSGFNLDLGTLMNVQKVLTGINQADPRRDLLNSLRPFLRENRQKNIDTYITLLGVMKAFSSFTDKDRD